MSLGLRVTALAALCLSASAASAQRPVRPAFPDDPAVGAWRGTIGTGAENRVPLVLSLVRRGDAYVGAVNIGGANEAPLGTVTVEGDRVSLESAAESKLGAVALHADLIVAGNALDGTGTISIGPLAAAVTVELAREARADVLQPVVEQRAEYFVGTWSFEYLGAEQPPLSPGSRAGTATFSSAGPDSVVGRIEGDIDGKPFAERWSMTFDPATHMLAVVERRDGGPELLSVADWRTPLAIRFTTAPVTDGGHRYQLRRLLRVISDVSFDLTEELAIDGGPFRRLGSASFERTRR